jgi:hypothetical protein
MLAKLFFTRRSSEFKLSRRQRINTLVRLARITEQYSPDELGDSRTEAHRKLVELLKTLAEDKRGQPRTDVDVLGPAASIRG